MYQGQLRCAESPVMEQPDSLRQKLENKRQYLECELAQINEACEALDSNPEVSRIIESITKTNMHY